MTDVQITPAGAPSEDLIPPLDKQLEIQLSAPELAFLREAITGSEDEVKKKIKNIQKEAYTKFPYPCIRRFHFVSVHMAIHSIYPKILEEGRSGSTVFLDLGCMMGTDVRKLVHDGYPAANVVACDLRQEFIDIGFQLFGDEEKCPIHFFACDVFTVPLDGPTYSANVPLHQVSALAQLRGKIDHVYTGSLFHLFDESTQIAIALRITTLLKRRGTVTIFGRHRGEEQAAITPDPWRQPRYLHSPKSWTEMWQSVFSRSEGAEFARKRVVVKAELVGEDRFMYWSVEVSWA